MQDVYDIIHWDPHAKSWPVNMPLAAKNVGN